MGYRDYSTAKGHIVDTTGHGDFTTIAAALSAASSGQTIFVRPGTYAENLILKTGVNITAYDCDAQGNVTISGKLTATYSGNAVISGINLQTNNDYALSITGSNPTVVNLINCTCTGLNNTVFNLSSSSSGAVISMLGGIINLETTGIAYHTMSSPGGINYLQTTILNGGSSKTLANNSAGGVSIQNCSCSGFFSNSSTGVIGISNCEFTSLLTSPFLQINGTSTPSTSHNSTYISAGTSALITIGAGATLNLTHAHLDVGNINAVTGTGTLAYAFLSFAGSATGVSVSTLSPFATLI